MNNKTIILSAVITSLCFFSFVIKAQSPEPYLDFAKKKKEQKIIKIKDKASLFIEYKEEGWSISEMNVNENFYLDNTSNFNLEDKVVQSSFFKIKDIKASSLSYENNRYKEYKVTDFKTKDNLERSFYDDSQSILFSYPKLGKNSISKLKYETEITDPKFINPFYFGSSIACMSYEYEISCDKNIELDFRYFNCSPEQLNFKVEEKKGRKIYSWSMKDVSGLDSETRSPGFKYFMPHVIPIIKFVEKKGKKTTILADLSDLHNWYYSLVKNINQESCLPEMATTVKRLTENCETDLEKVKNIYYWTQQNIKYIDFEYALGGFIPREANEVFERKFGDCKDNSSIMKVMLQEAGLNGELTWIGTRSIPYSYDEVPTPVSDNHMILCYKDANDTYFLDATGRFTPLSHPTSFIQGKEALVNVQQGKYEVIKVPIMPSDSNIQIDTSILTIEGKDIKGKGICRLTGYQKQDWFVRLENIQDENDLKKFYRNRLMKGNNKFQIQDIEESNKFEYDEDFIVSYDFLIGDYLSVLDNEIYVNLNLNQDILGLSQSKERKLAIERDYKYKNVFTYVLNIPNGYTAEYIPEDMILQSEFMELGISYHQEDNKIYCTHTEISKFLLIEAEKQEKINAMIKKIRRGFKETIVLKKL